VQSVTDIIVFSGAFVMLSSVLFIHLDAVEARLASVSELAALGFREEPQNWLSSLMRFEGPRRRFAIKRVFADPEKLTSKMRQAWMSIGFDVIDCVQQDSMRSAAEVRFIIDAMDLVHSSAQFEEVMLLAGETDLSPLLHRLRARLIKPALLVSGQTPHAIRSLADVTISLDVFAKATAGDLDASHYSANARVADALGTSKVTSFVSAEPNVQAITEPEAGAAAVEPTPVQAMEDESVATDHEGNAEKSDRLEDLSGDDEKVDSVSEVASSEQNDAVTDAYKEDFVSASESSDGAVDTISDYNTDDSEQSSDTDSEASDDKVIEFSSDSFELASAPIESEETGGAYDTSRDAHAEDDMHVQLSDSKAETSEVRDLAVEDPAVDDAGTFSLTQPIEAPHEESEVMDQQGDSDPEKNGDSASDEAFATEDSDESAADSVPVVLSAEKDDALDDDVFIDLSALEQEIASTSSEDDTNTVSESSKNKSEHDPLDFDISDILSDISREKNDDASFNQETKSDLSHASDGELSSDKDTDDYGSKSAGDESKDDSIDREVDELLARLLAEDKDDSAEAQRAANEQDVGESRLGGFLGFGRKRNAS
jgi:hypothetical protein